MNKRRYRMHRRALVVVLAGLYLAACDIRLDMADGTPTASPTGPTITNTNTNTSTNNNDRSDTAPAPSSPSSPNGDAALPLPTYGEAVTRDFADKNPALLANSCQDKTGATAWQFLDQLLGTLRARDRDHRWGYLCKDANCLTFGRDVITYKATAADTGIWIVDVIGNHCPLANETAMVRWGVLPFETARRWAASRK